MQFLTAKILSWNNISSWLIKYFCSKPLRLILVRSLVALCSLHVLVCAGIRYPGMCVSRVLKSPGCCHVTGDRRTGIQLSALGILPWCGCMGCCSGKTEQLKILKIAEVMALVFTHLSRGLIKIVFYWYAEVLSLWSQLPVFLCKSLNNMHLLCCVWDNTSPPCVGSL